MSKAHTPYNPLHVIPEYICRTSHGDVECISLQMLHFVSAQFAPCVPDATNSKLKNAMWQIIENLKV